MSETYPTSKLGHGPGAEGGPTLHFVVDAPESGGYLAYDEDLSDANTHVFVNVPPPELSATTVVTASATRTAGD